MLFKCRNELETSDLNLWTDTVRDLFGGLEMSVPNPAEFSGKLEVRQVKSFKLAMVKSTASHVWHNGSVGAFSEAEQFLVKTQFSGESFIRFGGEAVKLQVGDFVICDNARSYALDFDVPSEVLSIPLPKKLLGRFHAQPQTLAFRRADRTLAGNQITSDFIQSLWNARMQQASERQSMRLIEYYFDLLVMGFGAVEPSETRISTAQLGLLERCKVYINENLHDDNLTPDEIAAALSISRRYLFSVFAGAGLKVSTYIVSKRLDRAAQFLRSRRFDKLTVSEIAFECGFKSAAHFSRAFKARFSESPSQYRSRVYS